MTCRDCGRVSEGRLCRECERDRRWEDRFDEAFDADDGDDDDAGAAPVATDGGSKYVVQTGDGYVGTFVVGHHSCAVNMVTAGYERGADLVVVVDGDRVATITPPPADSEAVLQSGAVNDDGYFAITVPVQDHLGVENGDDVRLYETEAGHAIVDADDDPFAATDGGEAIDYEGAGFVVASVYLLDSMRELADDPATPSGIAEATGNDIPHISRALGNLREKGLVELLVPEVTHKGRIYGLTERGESVLSAANQVVRHDAGGDGP